MQIPIYRVLGKCLFPFINQFRGSQKKRLWQKGFFKGLFNFHFWESQKKDFCRGAFSFPRISKGSMQKSKPNMWKTCSPGRFPPKTQPPWPEKEFSWKSLFANQILQSASYPSSVLTVSTGLVVRNEPVAFMVAAAAAVVPKNVRWTDCPVLALPNAETYGCRACH